METGYSDESELTEESLPEMEQRLIALVRERGFEDPEASELLNQWMDKQQEIADQTRGSEGRIEMARRQGRLYFECGYREAAQESFEAAADQAYQERKDELCVEIEKEWMVLNS